MQIALDNLIESGRTIGKIWYSQAEGELYQVAYENGWNPEDFAGIIAVTSPKVSVRRNIRQALEIMGNSRYFDSVLSNVVSSVEHYVVTGVIRGRKTSAFRDALLGDQTALVLDSHMSNVFRIPQATIFRKDNYSKILRVIVRLSRRHKLTISQTQASLWCGQLQATGKTAQLFPILQEFENWRACNFRFPEGTIQLKI